MRKYVVIITSCLDSDSDYVICGEFKRFSSEESAILVSSNWNYTTRELQKSCINSPRSNQWAIPMKIDNVNHL